MDGPDSDELLELQGLTVAFDSARSRGQLTVVDGVSLSVRRGQTVAVLGESGSGKSMTAYAVMGLLPNGARVTAGTVMYRGRDMARDSRFRAEVRGEHVGMVLQSPHESLNPSSSVGAHFKEVLRGSSRYATAAEQKQRALELLELVRLPNPGDMLSRYSIELSGGMCQRICIALALAREPSFLLADEPTTALDATTQTEVLRLLEDLQASQRIGLLVITHDIGVAVKIADTLAVMYAGGVVESGDTQSVVHDPLHPYTRALLEATPAVPRSQRLRPIPGSPPALGARPPGCAFAPRCRFAADRCQVEEPGLRTVRENRAVACHFWEEIHDQRHEAGTQR